MRSSDTGINAIVAGVVGVSVIITLTTGAFIHWPIVAGGILAGLFGGGSGAGSGSRFTIPCACECSNATTSRRKRHLLVDTLGLVLLVWVSATNIQDRDAARTLLARLAHRFSRLVLIWAGGG